MVLRAHGRAWSTVSACTLLLTTPLCERAGDFSHMTSWAQQAAQYSLHPDPHARKPAHYSHTHALAHTRTAPRVFHTNTQTQQQHMQSSDAVCVYITGTHA